MLPGPMPAQSSVTTPWASVFHGPFAPHVVVSPVPLVGQDASTCLVTVGLGGGGEFFSHSHILVVSTAVHVEAPVDVQGCEPLFSALIHALLPKL